MNQTISSKHLEIRENNMKFKLTIIENIENHTLTSYGRERTAARERETAREDDGEDVAREARTWRERMSARFRGGEHMAASFGGEIFTDSVENDSLEFGSKKKLLMY